MDEDPFAFELQHPTADWKPLAHCNYRKRELYDLEWGADLAKLTVVGAPFGGPLALSRDEKQILLVTGDQPLKPQTQIYTSSGNLISSFVWDSSKGRVVKTGWITEERLVFVMESGAVAIYNIHGEVISTFTLGQDCCQQGVLQCHIWNSGLVVMTNALRFYAVPNINEPKVRLLADPGLQQPPVSWCIVEPEYAASHQVEVIVSTPTASIIILNADRATDLKFVSMGPFLKMTVSPAGDYVACFSEDGHLLVVQIDFAKSASRFDTQSKKAPKHLVWCGSDAVLMYWPGVGILMVGPAPDAWYRYAYDEPVHLIPECDGARIITNHKCEFLQRVPKVTEAIFGIGSTTAAATLYDAVVDFQRKSPKADEGIRSIRAELSDAVDACIEAAGHEFSPIMQRRLLKAASFGKSFLETYDADLFVDMCKTLRVLNSVRQPNVGIPLTYQQYKLLTPKRLLDFLINRHHHALAWHICGYLNIKRDAVLVHWACLKVRSEGTEREILSTIVNKLQAVPAISFAEIASAAYRHGRTELATKLLDYEPRAAEQVPLLITMQEDELALAKAIQSGDTDLVYLVLLHVRRSRSAVEFFRMLKGRPEALDLLIAYCKQQDLDLLKDIYYQAGMPQESANIAVLEAYQHTDLDKRVRGLQIALNLYKDTKEPFAAKATETQIRLLLQQRELEAAIPDSEFVGCSLSDTLYRLIRTGHIKQAAKIRSDFKVPDKRFWWIQIKALAMARSWPELEALANSKKSPIGYRPFAEVCIDQGANGEAIKYIARMADPAQKVEILLSISRWREAAEAAMELKPDQAVPLLEDIRARCPERAEQHYITQLLQSLTK